MKTLNEIGHVIAAIAAYRVARQERTSSDVYRRRQLASGEFIIRSQE